MQLKQSIWKVTTLSKMKFLYFISLIVLATAYPANNDLEYRELSSGKFEGDMILDPIQQQIVDGYYPRTGLINERYRWAGATVPYTFSSALSTAQRSYILESFVEMERVTCLKFVERTTQTDYVEVITTVGSGGCWSYVGRQGGRQQLHLQSYQPGQGCFRNGTIMHEFIHAIGFYHMQSAYDRDDFVRIVWENIQPGTENNFRKYDNTQITHFGEVYDFGSVMHYPAVSFSINGQPTIIPLVENAPELGQRYKLTDGDINRINSMYNCGA